MPSSRAHHRDGIAVRDQRQRTEYCMLAVCVESFSYGHPKVTLDVLHLFRRIHYSTDYSRASKHGGIVAQGGQADDRGERG